MPADTLSTSPVPAVFTGPRAMPVQNLVDFEYGGIGIQDPSRGLMYQVWRCRVIGNSLILDAPNTPAFSIHDGAAPLTEVSLAFDQNMRPTIAFVEGGRAKLLWYDSAIPGETVTELAAGVITPRVALDDKRQSQLGISDIILAYLRDGGLYYRQQRDRFLVEIDPTADMPEEEREAARAQVAASGGLIKIGMNRQLRLQFMLAYGTSASTSSA